MRLGVIIFFLIFVPVFLAPSGAPQFQLVYANVTAYNSIPNQTDGTPFITASGKHVHPGTLACPRGIPFGTKVLIDGKPFTCEDRMNPKFADRFDIWMSSKEDAIDWGIRKVEVKVLLSTS